MSDDPPALHLDHADRAMLRLLSARARMDVHDIARRLGLTPAQVRARLLHLRRSGVIVGYRAVVGKEFPCASALAMVRFPAGTRPGPAELCRMDGVRRVLELASGWDYLLELSADARVVLNVDVIRDGAAAARILGRPATVALLSICTARSADEEVDAVRPLATGARQ